MPKVTMKQVAEAAGVSLSTVSRVLNSSTEYVADDMREHVIKVAKALDYSFAPSPAKKAKVSHSVTKLGVLVTDIQNSSMGRLLGGIFSVADNYDLEIIVKEYNFQEAKQRKALETLARAGVDGIISVEVNDAELIPYYQEIVSKKLPLVIVSNTKTNLEHDGISVVCNDTDTGMMTGYKYLLSLGHKRILILGVPGDRKRFRYRILALRQGLRAINERLDDSCLLDCKNTYQDAYMAIDRLCKEGKFNYTAIFAMSDVMAYGAMEALQMNEMSVGKDVSVLGYDDLPSSEYMSLSSIAEPMYALGTNAVYMIMDRIQRQDTHPHRISQQDSLQIRRSCCRFVEK